MVIKLGERLASALGQCLLSVIIASLSALSFIFVLYGFVSTGYAPKFSFSSGAGSAMFSVGYVLLIPLFVFAWVSEYPSIFHQFVEIEPRHPASLREIHIVLLTVFLPVVFVAGALFIVTAVQPSFELYASFALWFELAYIMSFVVLRGIFGGMFCMSYVGAALSSPVAAKGLALRSVKRIQESRPLAGTKDLQATYLMTADWLRSLGYESEPLTYTIQRLSIALDLDTHPSEDSLRALAEALEKLPAWPDLVTELRKAYLPDLAWTSSINPIPTRKKSKGLDMILGVLIAVGTLFGAFATLLSPFLSVYVSAFVAAMNAVGPWSLVILMGSAVLILFVFCYVQWRRAWNSVWPEVEGAKRILDEMRLSQRTKSESVEDRQSK